MRRNSKSKGNKFILLLFLIIGINLVQPLTSKALNAPTTVKDNTAISADYSFIPRFMKGTELETFGSGWKLKKTISKKSQYYAIVPRESQKGKIGVYYRNVGTFDGKSIDLKITVTDWDQYFKKKGNISYRVGRIGHISQGYNYVRQNWEFIDKKGRNVDVSAYMTINDIDSFQSMKLTPTTSKNIKDVYVTKDTWVNVDHSDFYRFGYSGKETSEDTDEYAMTTFTYSGTGNLEFLWQKDYAAQNEKKDYDLDTSLVDDKGEYFGFGGYKLARTETTKPYKYVEETKNPVEGQRSVEMTSYLNTLLFKVQFDVNDELKKYRYKSFSISDTIDSDFTIMSSKVIDGDGEDITNFFVDETKGNKLKFTAKDTVLTDGRFYDKQYTLVVKVKLQGLAELNSKYPNISVMEWDNTATIKQDEKSRDSNTVKVKLKRYPVDVQHISKKTGELLDSEPPKKYLVGEKVTKSPKTNLVYTFPEEPSEDSDSENEEEVKEPKTTPYIPVVNKSVTKTITKPYTFKFYYVLPNASVGIKKIQIYTAPSKEGLPLNIDFDVQSIPDSEGDWKNNKITYTVFQRDASKEEHGIDPDDEAAETELFSKTVSLGNLLSTQKIQIPSKFLDINERKNYIIRLDAMGSDDVMFLPDQEEINTDGYTSKEAFYEFNSVDNKEYNEKLVVMTERFINEKMKIYYETIQIPLSTIPKTKSGYGIDLSKTIKYHNDLGLLKPMKATIRVSPELIDTYLIYGLSDGMKTVPVINKSNEGAKDLEQTITTENVYVERMTGNLFSETQKSKGDSRIENELLNGGSKVYIPIWIKELGGYDTTFETIEPFGINKISILINRPVEVYAFMYAHMDSPTIDEDEILIVPVDTKDPFKGKVPNGWSKEDIEWLKK